MISPQAIHSIIHHPSACFPNIIALGRYLLRAVRRSSLYPLEVLANLQFFKTFPSWGSAYSSSHLSAKGRILLRMNVLLCAPSSSSSYFLVTLIRVSTSDTIGA